MKTREIALSAMIMSVIGVFLLLDRLTGSSLIFMVQFLLPVPFAFFTAQHGNRNGFFLLLATVIMTFIISTLIGTISIVFYGLMGWIYGIFVNRNANRLQLLLISFVADLVIIVITMYAMGSIMGYGTLPEQIEYLKEMMVTVFGSIGLSAEIVDVLLMPLFYLQTLLTAFLEAYLVHTIYLLVTYRMKKPLPESKKLSDVKWPIFSGYLAMALWLGSYLIPKLQLTGSLREILLFVSILGQWYLIFHGFLFFYRVKNKPIFRRIGFYSIIILILLPNLLVMPIAFLGFLALVSDLVERASA